MFKKQITMNVEKIDIEIGKLSYRLSGGVDDDEFERIYSKLSDLTEIRSKLTDSKVKQSNLPMVLSGVIQISGILLVLHYEKTDVVTSKVFSIATRLFKGGE